MKSNIKIGLYLQTQTAYDLNKFEEAMDKAREADFDILVFPENCFCPQYIYMINTCAVDDDYTNVDIAVDCALDISKRINKAVVLSLYDYEGGLFSVYANINAQGEETYTQLYFKHTMTEFSAFDFSDYREFTKECFKPIIYKDVRIGLSICYDCNHAIFSRMWGKHGIDIMINSTGGDVVYDKWYKYNKARAIENNFFNFVTMGGIGEGKNPKSYVYGFNRNGKELPFKNLMKRTDKANEINTIYVFDTSDNAEAGDDKSLNQKESKNKNSQFNIPQGDVKGLLDKSKELEPNLYVLKRKENNIVFLLLEENDIMQCEKVLSLMYSDKLKRYKNKKYVIVSRYKNLDEKFYRSKLSLILKVRAMENFCAVILESDKENHCYQSGKNRTAQVIEPTDQKYKLDLDRMSGPESIWKNKEGMRESWRDNLEWLIKECSKI